jgi:hypothetical protein
MSILRTFSSAASRPFFTPPITGVNGSNYWEKTVTFPYQGENYIQANGFLWMAENNIVFYANSAKYTLTNGIYIGSDDLFLTSGSSGRLSRSGNDGVNFYFSSSWYVQFLEKTQNTWGVVAQIPFTHSGSAAYWILNISQNGNAVMQFFALDGITKFRIYRKTQGIWGIIVDTNELEPGLGINAGNISGDGNTFAGYAGTSTSEVNVYKWNDTITDLTIGNNWTKTGEISNSGRFVSGVYLNEDGTVLLVITYEFNGGGSGWSGYNLYYNAYKFNGTTWQQMGSTVTAYATNYSTGTPVPNGQILNKEGNIFFVRNDASLQNRSMRAYKWNGTSWGQMGPQVTANFFAPRIFINESGSKMTVARDLNSGLPIEQYQYIS